MRLVSLAAAAAQLYLYPYKSINNWIGIHSQVAFVFFDLPKGHNQHGETIGKNQQGLPHRKRRAAQPEAAQRRSSRAYHQRIQPAGSVRKAAASRVVTRRIMDLLKGHDWAPLDRSIDNLVAKLRKNVEKDPDRPALIKTVRSVGYTFTGESNAREPLRSRP